MCFDTRMSLPVASARLVLTLLLGTSLAACGTNSTLGSGTTSSREILSFRNTALPEAYANEPYTASVGVSGGVNPYSVRVTSGALPPGLRLSGTSITGTPTQTGRFEFTLEAADATLSTRSQALALTVTTLPPVALTPTLGSGNAANTTFRSDTRVPLRLTAPRGSRALRFSWRLPNGVEVTRVQPGDGTPLLLWKQSPGLLTVVLGFPKEPTGGANVALVSMRFAGPTKLDAAQVGLEARDATGKLIAEAALPPVTPPASGAPAGTTPTTSPATPAAGTSATATTPSTPSTAAPGGTPAAQGTPPEVAGPPAPATPAATNPPPAQTGETAPEPQPPTTEATEASTPETNDTADETTTDETTEAPTAEPSGAASEQPTSETATPAGSEPNTAETQPAEATSQGERAAPVTTPEAAPAATAPSPPAAGTTPTPAATASAPTTPSTTEAAKPNEPKALDLGDFALLAVNFGRTGENLPGDLDKNGKVDAADVRLFSQRYPLP